MLLQTFYENEVVQILDPATSIWESAKIISFVSDCCVRIKWVDWSYNKKEDITVPEVYRPENQSRICGKGVGSSFFPSDLLSFESYEQFVRKSKKSKNDCFFGHFWAKLG